MVVRSEDELPESVAVSPSDKSSDRAQSDANNAAAVASQTASTQARETARLLAAFTHTTVIRLLLANFVLTALTTVIVFWMLLRDLRG